MSDQPPGQDALALQARLADAEKNERHRNLKETMYWFHQYKRLAIDAVEAAAALSGPPGQDVLRALVAKWRAEAADEQRVSFCADELEAALSGASSPGPVDEAYTVPPQPSGDAQ